ncbi:MAG: Fe-S cluster assembly protein SufD [Parvibaculum sp.]|nr:Fe-S cluster assembly protein SufD [Parvibaculum sp.]
MSEAAKTFIETYQHQRDALAAAGPDWLRAARDAAMDAFAQAGLPHRRMEDWRYTDLARLLEKATLTPVPLHSGSVALPADRHSFSMFNAIDRHVIVFVDGLLRADLSDIPSGVSFAPLGDVLGAGWTKALIEAPVNKAQATNVLALNLGLMSGGFGLHLAVGQKLAKPLHLVHLALGDGASHSRNLIRLDDGAEATIYETCVSAGATNYFADAVTNVSLGEGARLTLVKVQDEAAGGIHLATLSAQLYARSYLSAFTMTLGAGLSRCQNFVRFEGEGAEAHVNGATALRGRQQGDQFCVTDHAVPHCTSATLFRTVLDDAATGVFQGKVIVRPHAQKTDGRQMSNALILSRDAAMNAKPELEIYADDVQCAHGSTIGELNREALFYLRSRGIDEQSARQLLISAFLDEAFETVPDEAAREGLRGLAADWFRLSEKESA